MLHCFGALLAVLQYAEKEVNCGQQREKVNLNMLATKESKSLFDMNVKMLGTKF